LEAEVAKQGKTASLRGRDAKVQVLKTSKGGTNNLRCGCTGVLKRDGKGGMTCTGCGKGKVETPL